jgi:RNA polymerase sigma-70 factor (ECF subfamily)
LSELTPHPTALVRPHPSAGPAGRAALIARTHERLRQYAHWKLKGFPVVARWGQTDDVLQNALLRLYRALEAVPLEDADHFYHLAELQIIRELHDLAKRHRGPHGIGANHRTDPDGEKVAGAPDRAGEPSSVAEWEEFHRAVEALPDEEREVFQLLWYVGLTQEEAAEVLEVHVRTVKRRWQRARRGLGEK